MADKCYTKPRGPIDIGERFGRLIAVKHIGFTKSRNRIFLCICDCGTKCEVNAGDLRRGSVRSCGCYRRDKHRVHGLSHLPEYKIWKGIRKRCKNPNDANFKNYGGRGIAVCQRWDSFEMFYDDMGPRPTPQHTIERIDNDAGYQPDNCRWATYKDQANNTRRNRHVIFNGQRLTLAKAIEVSGINLATVDWRIQNGWPEDRWFIMPQR